MELLGFNINNWLLIVTFILVGLYVLLTWRFNELKELGIPHPKPIPFFGNVFDILGGGFRDFDLKFIKKYGKIYGYYEGAKPTITVGDPKIMKQILIKDFHKFTDRRQMWFRGTFKHGVFDTNGAHWKVMRSQLTPAFSSGKLKALTGIMNKCSNVFTSHMAKNMQKTDVIETKAICQAFSMDVIASTAFGVHLDTQADPKSTFNIMGSRIFDLSATSPLIYISFFISEIAPLLDWLTMRTLCIFDKGAMNYFSRFVKQIIAEKKKDNKHSDFLGMMIDAETDTTVDQEVLKEREVLDKVEGDIRKTGLSTNEIIGNGITFFSAGFETTATTFAYILYFLAVNQDVQEKLQKEIDGLLGDKMEATYDQLSKMHYLDMIINETLRIATPVPRFDRVAKEAVDYEGLHIPKGMIVNLPYFAVHRDPEVWPDPEKFDPERFSPEQKAKRDPIHFLPFGQGPRICIGMRLALMELKLVMAQIVRKFTFHPCDKTAIPLTFDTDHLFPQTKGGLWVKVKKR